jgi:hypothetical protein
MSNCLQIKKLVKVRMTFPVESEPADRMVIDILNNTVVSANTPRQNAIITERDGRVISIRPETADNGIQ